MSRDRRRPRINLAGMRFGRLVVIAYAGGGKWAWSCVCDCGARVLIRGDHLRRGVTRSCGCLNREWIRARNIERKINLTGKRFGRWTVNAYAENGNWFCVCDCGMTGSIAGGNLRRGHSKSCGCLASELSSKRATTHGMHGTPEYRSWRSMKARCLNPRHVHFDCYGGRNLPVTIYPDWIPSFAAWFADAGSRPLGCSLDRIDPSGNYEPDNIRWSDAKQQRQNQRPPRKRATVKRPPLDDPPF
jgi:hypothetical protein